MKAQTMRRVRQYHFYLGMLFAPAILLFALSGALQTFRLPETKGYGSRPPGWIVWMASVHKDQSLPHTKPEPLPNAKPSAKPAEVPRKGGHRPSERISPLPLKVFVAIMSIGLLASAILGIFIALTNQTMRRTSIIILSGWGSVTPYTVDSLSACFSSGRAVLTAGEKRCLTSCCDI